MAAARALSRESAQGSDAARKSLGLNLGALPTARWPRPGRGSGLDPPRRLAAPCDIVEKGQIRADEAEQQGAEGGVDIKLRSCLLAAMDEAV